MLDYEFFLFMSVKPFLFCPLSRKGNIFSLCDLGVSSEVPVSGTSGR
jgi:hypothetical protein